MTGKVYSIEEINEYDYEKFQKNRKTINVCAFYLNQIGEKEERQ